MLKPERFRILANQREHLTVVADKALLKCIRECSDRCNADGVPARSDRRGSGAGKDRPKAKGARRSEPVLSQGREEALSKARER